MKMLISVIVAALCILGAVKAAADDTESWTDRLALTGWAETVSSFRTSDPGDALTARARMRLELSGRFDAFYGLISADAEKNWKIDDESGVDLHEAWLEYASEGWDVRLGRQIIIWGKADGVQITDIISPPDYTESITRDLDEIRLPVDAVKLRLLGEYVDTELIWIPVFEAAVLPTGDNPWAVAKVLPANVRACVASVDEPDTSFENSEIALKVSAFLSGLDVAASVFYTWDDYPTARRTAWSDGDIINVAYAPEHHRLTVFGLDFSRPWSDFVFRGEAAYYKGRYYETTSLYENPVAKDAVKWLIGSDWTPGDDWTVIVQLTGDYIIDREQCMADKASTLMATLNVSKKLLRQTLTLSNMVYYGIDDNELYNRAKAEYAVTDAFHLSVGVDAFQGDRDGQFGVYEENTQVWIKAKYCF
jgi:hypothetical protein